MRTRVIIWRSKQIKGNTAAETFLDNIASDDGEINPKGISRNYTKVIPIPSSSNIEIVKYTEFDPKYSSMNYESDLDPAFPA